MTTTDLFGKPLSGAPEFKLSLTQKRQATMLYHWMSQDYLKGLKTMIDALIDGVDVDLALAKEQGRDQVLVSERWGVSDTAVNWSTHVYPALEDFRQSTVRLMAWRAAESYCGTGADQCSRMISEHSSLWMTPDEEKRFKAEFEKVCRYAAHIDEAAGVGGERTALNDAGMDIRWHEGSFSKLYPRLPKFRVRTDVAGESGKRPVRTGVYVPQTDPHGVLQFGWTGNSDGDLGEVQTFNDIGLRALAAVGRQALWQDGAAIARYAGPLFASGHLPSAPYDVKDGSNPRWAPAMLRRLCRSSLPCKWYFVERVEGEYEDEPQVDSAHAPAEQTRGRCEAGQPCPREGFWFTPAQASSRHHFSAGEEMPAVGGDYGATIWQWDQNQDPPKP